MGTEACEQTDMTPPGFTDAQWHADAIADSGHGYTIKRGWHVRCCWCPWEATERTKTEAVAAYRAHEAERFDQLRREDLAAACSPKEGTQR